MGRKKKSITQKQLEVLSARVNFTLYKEIEEIAKADDLNMTQILRQALREWLLRRNKRQRKEAA